MILPASCPVANDMRRVSAQLSENRAVSIKNRKIFYSDGGVRLDCAMIAADHGWKQPQETQWAEAHF